MSVPEFVDRSPPPRPDWRKSMTATTVWIASILLHAAALWWLSILAVPRGNGGAGTGDGIGFEAEFLGAVDDSTTRGARSVGAAANESLPELLLVGAESIEIVSSEAEDFEPQPETRLESP